MRRVAYGFSAIGVLADSLTTRLAVGMMGLSELNTRAAWLMSRGLWLPVDLVFLCIQLIAVEQLRIRYGARVLIVPALMGAVRLACAVNNILHIIGA